VRGFYSQGGPLMKRIITAASLLLLSSMMYHCDDDTEVLETILPLSGSYNLTNLTISVEATTINDTTITLLEAVNGSTSYSLMGNTLLLTEYAEHSILDSVPISGLVVLENDGSATLSGMLPVNWGTGCAPFELISSLASDGTWSADTTTGTFSIDLVVDALDIEGNFSMVGDQLEIRYFTQTPADQRMINTLPINGSDVPVEQTCIAVSTITERVMLLDIEN